MATRPWFKFYPTSWRSDQGLRFCSLAARGLWIELLCVMHAAKPYGHLVVNGISPTMAQIANLSGTLEAEAEALLSELERAGVFSRNKAKTIYSRRMVKDEKKRIDGETAQKKPRTAKDDAPANTIENTQQIPEPQGSPQGSFDGDPAPKRLEVRSTSKKEGDADASPKKNASRGSRMPEGWMPTPEGQAWAVDQLGSERTAGIELEKLRDWAKQQPGAKGVKLDWDATHRNWIRTAAERKGASNVAGYFRSDAPRPSPVPIVGSPFAGPLARAAVARGMERDGGGARDHGEPEFPDIGLRARS